MRSIPAASSFLRKDWHRCSLVRSRRVRRRGASILVGFILVFTAAYFFIAQTTGRGILFDIGSRYLQLLAILYWAWQVYDAYSLTKA